jgi:hypothetical protein
MKMTVQGRTLTIGRMIGEQANQSGEPWQGHESSDDLTIFLACKKSVQAELKGGEPYKACIVAQAFLTLKLIRS